MSSKPIFVASHPRACSTAFERVFMTQRDVLECIHEPFGDAFYFGPERLSLRYEDDEEARIKSGFANTTYNDVMEMIQQKSSEGKRVFIKDIIHYLVPSNGAPAKPAPSFVATAGTKSETDGVNGPAAPRAINPTVVPVEQLRKFHFTFLIRHPRRSIPSYYRCTIPPLDKVTGFYSFMPSEAGYDELRRVFDYLKAEGIVGPSQAGEPTEKGKASITVVDADDLLDKPAEVIEAFCKEVGIDYTPGMLRWEDEESQEHARKAFSKWNGFHNDVLDSTFLKPRSHAMKDDSTPEEDDKEWREKYGAEGAKVIRECVDANTQHYEYLKSFAIRV